VLKKIWQLHVHVRVQLKKRFPDGAVLVEWGKRDDAEDADVWFLNKLEDLAANMACVPEEYNGAKDSMVCYNEVLSSTTLSDTDH
jgi:hypothetical protein